MRGSFGLDHQPLQLLVFFFFFFPSLHKHFALVGFYLQHHLPLMKWYLISALLIRDEGFFFFFFFFFFFWEGFQWLFFFSFLVSSSGRRRVESLVFVL
jgi:hypothetical protein